jgi:tRNA G26 N,N-dimethylase Trm1
MRISKRQLRRIIEQCGLDAAPVAPVEELSPLLPKVEPLIETTTADAELVVEMEVASRALEQVVESVQNAAQLCPGCSDNVAVQGPIVEAMVAQAEALQEMLDAQTSLLAESIEVPAVDVVQVVDGGGI